MLDIVLIREKPDWIKEQLTKLNDEASIPRIDEILRLDTDRRTLLTDVEKVQSHRNKLNKGVGRLRGDKNLQPGQKIARAFLVTQALKAKDFAKAEAVLAGDHDPVDVDPNSDLMDALDDMTTELKNISNYVNEINDRVRQIDADLEENMLWLPNIPHESTPVADSEEANIAWEPEGEMPEFDFTAKTPLGFSTRVGHY